MGKERTPHDPAYKQFFSNPRMVESLLRDFVPADFIADLDFSKLERCPGNHVTDDLRERRDDIVWRLGWKKDNWCYVALLLEFQSTPDHWMALRVLSYTALLLLGLIKSGEVKGKAGLPPVLPIVVYNGGTAWNAPQDVEALFAPMPEGLERYRPRHRYFLLDENRVPGEELEKSRGLVAQLLRLERAQGPDQVRQIVNELRTLLDGSECAYLDRAFAVWLDRVVLQRSGMAEGTHDFQNLQEVASMLEERTPYWKDKYIHQGLVIGRAEGKAEGKAEGRAEGILALQVLLEARFGTLPQSVISFISSASDSIALQELTLSAYHAESLQAFVEQMKKEIKLM